MSLLRLQSAAHEQGSLRRYQLPIVVIVLNNGGIYGGDRRQPALQEAARAGAARANFSADPVPTAFVADARCALGCTSAGGGKVVVMMERCSLCMLRWMHDACHSSAIRMRSLLARSAQNASCHTALAVGLTDKAVLEA